MDQAAAKGYLEIVRFLHGNRPEGCTTDAMDKAAAKGHLQVVCFLHENRSEGCTAEAVDRADKARHRDVIRFLYLNQHEGIATRGIISAAKRGDVELVREMLEKRQDVNFEETLVEAALSGHREVFGLIMATQTGTLIASKAVFYAVVKAKWEDEAHAMLIADASLCTPEALCVTASSSSFVFFKLLFNLVPRVLPWTATEAARNDRTEIVQFILERSPNCRHEHVLVGAALGGSVETVRFLLENYHQYCTPGAFYEAARYGHVDVLRYLLVNCCVSPSGLLLRAVYSENPEVVQLILDRWPNEYLAEARAIAVRRFSGGIISLLDDAISRSTGATLVTIAASGDEQARTT